jgi:hypothetical protein
MCYQHGSMKSVVLVSLILLAAIQDSQDHSAVPPSYFDVVDALADDNYVEAKSALRSLASETNNSAMKSTVESAAAATDSAAMRKAFRSLSDDVTKMQMPKGYMVVICRMYTADNIDGGHWLQKRGELKNPYWGKKMLTCGTIERTS